MSPGDDHKPPAPSPHGPAPSTTSVGVVVVMEEELRHLLTRVTVEREIDDGVWHERHGEAGAAGVKLVMIRCGIGTISAAAATERLIHVHRPRAVLNFGCAGAHRRDILPGDVVVGERVVHHSAVHVLAGGEEHYHGGASEIAADPLLLALAREAATDFVPEPWPPEFGWHMAVPYRTPTVHHAAVHILASGDELFVGSSYDVGGERMAASELPADPALLALAREVTTGWAPEPWPRNLGWPPAVPYRNPAVHAGVVASADVWTQAHARLDLLHGRHRSLCEDMEAAAIAQICARHSVPFLSIKDISNNEYHAASNLEGGFTDFPTVEVGKRAAALTLRVLERLASDSARAGS